LPGDETPTASRSRTSSISSVTSDSSFFNNSSFGTHHYQLPSDVESEIDESAFNFLIFLAVCLNISTVINIQILTNSNLQTQSYKFTCHLAAFLSVVLITEMLEICI
jgi:hypothetical protein